MIPLTMWQLSSSGRTISKTAFGTKYLGPTSDTTSRAHKTMRFLLSMVTIMGLLTSQVMINGQVYRDTDRNSDYEDLAVYSDGSFDL